MVSSLDIAVRSVLLPADEVTQLAALRRSTCFFVQGQPADAVFFIEDGLVKLTRTNGNGSRLILSICGPGHLVGEEALVDRPAPYDAAAEALSTVSAFRIPRYVVMRALQVRPELASSFVTYLLERKIALAQKVELLCAYDVEHRILHYLAELASLVEPNQSGDGYQLPITQLELADLIGATRETTSTTLNQLERRGLVKLSRRLLTIPSPVRLRSAAAGHPMAEALIAS